MTDEMREWTPERPDSPWRTSRPWEFLQDEGRTCKFHGDYVAKLVRAHLPADWDVRLKAMSKAEAAAVKPLIKDWWTRCPRCDDQIHKEQLAFHHEAIHGEEERRALRAQQAARAGIPMRYLDVHVFDNLHPPLPSAAPKIQQVRTWANQIDVNLQSGRSLVISGSIGTGKTHAACGIANFLIGKGVSVHFTTENAMFESLKECFHNQESLRETTKRFTMCDVLVLDEVGRYTKTDFDEKSLGEIMNRRYSDCRPTIITTNLRARDLQTALGAAVWSRIKGNTQQVLFDWQDIRTEYDKNQGGRGDE